MQIPLNRRMGMKKRAELIFTLALLAVSIQYGYHFILFQRPSYHHIWRQTDCLSITKNYCVDNRNFFRPAMNAVGDKGGRTISEFPIIYFTVGQLWKVFGAHEFIFRLVNLLFVFTGLFALFKFCLEFFDDLFWAIFLPLFLFSSPILGYYASNFLPDAPALGLALTGGYLYWKALRTEKNKWYWLAFAVFLLAGLLKLSSMLLFVALLGIQLYRSVFMRKQNIWITRWARLWPYPVVIGLLVAWYRYAAYYNSQNLHGVFLNGILPIWDMSPEGRSHTWDTFLTVLVPMFFNTEALRIFPVILAILIASVRYVNRFFFSLMILLIIGCAGFLLLFFQVLDVHDYYLVNLLILIPLPLIALLDLLKRNLPGVFAGAGFKVVAGLALLVLLYMGGIRTRLRYLPRQAYVKDSIFVPKKDIEGYTMWDNYCSTYFGALETITPYLRSLGIHRDDLVYSTPDGTINVSLYLMDQKGFSDTWTNLFPEEQRMPNVLSLGCKYLIINDTAVCSKPYLAPYLKHRIGRYKNVVIYDLIH